MQRLETEKQFDGIIDQCCGIFSKKTEDYGEAWRILRPSSLTDQIYIKAKRIRSLQEKGGVGKINEGYISEFMGIINYSTMAIMQLEPEDRNTFNHFLFTLRESTELMLQKNHDYDEAWRNMRVSSITDIILQKLLRVKQIEDNDGKTLVSEGLVANYQDMINYAIFSIILISEKVVNLGIPTLEQVKEITKEREESKNA